MLNNYQNLIVKSSGERHVQFRYPLSGFANYNDRLIASHRENDPSISCYDKTEAMRKSPPKFLSKSINNIDPYLVKSPPKYPDLSKIEKVLPQINGGQYKNLDEQFPSLNIYQRNKINRTSGLFY